MDINLPITETNDAACSDDQLMAAIAQGSQNAFAVLMARHQPRVKALAMRVLYNEGAAEDAAQDAFAAVWQNRHKWEAGGPAKFSTWLYRVTLNRCVDIKRRMRVQIDLDDASSEAPLRENARAEGQIDDRQRASVLADLLQSLPEQQQLALRLYYYEERTIEDIAKKLGNTELGVRSLIKRAKASLRLHEDRLTHFI
jgi:RNA polymerase sigma-70 factor (ECF subfamily)